MLRWTTRTCCAAKVSAATAATAATKEALPSKATPPSDSGTPTAAAAKGGAAAAAAAAAPAKKARTSRPHTTFRGVGIPSWQRASISWNKRKNTSLPERLFVHGEQLGPRPLVILGSSVPDNVEAAAAAADVFAGIASQVGWSHGALYIPLTAAPDVAPNDNLKHFGDQVANVLDVFGIGWTHFLLHSVGALVGAKLTYQHPTRIGTLSILDTPIVEKQWIANHATRQDVAKALEDVNVPKSMLDFTIENLKQNVEPMLPCPNSSDASLYGELFEPAFLYGNSGGVTRNDRRYLSVDQLRGIKHPINLIVPNSGGCCDVNTHKEFFNIRRVQPIKAAVNHEGLLSASSEEVGSMLEQWLQRFEPDVIMARRYESAAKDMRQRMQTAAAPAAGTAAEAPKQAFPVGKKKEQKKQKQ